MNYLLLIGVLILTLVLIHFGYQKLKGVLLPIKKPFIQFFPKYCWKLEGNISQDELEKTMSTFGFQISLDNKKYIKFTRGSVLGDFSIKITKVNISFEKPLSKGSKVYIAYGNFAPVFDTGDLWKFTKELTKKIEKQQD